MKLPTIFLGQGPLILGKTSKDSASVLGEPEDSMYLSRVDGEG